MSAHESYLRSSLAKYKYPDLAKRDILNAFKAYTDLRPKLDSFVFNDGSKEELLCLDGTVPVSYKGATYNIPICLWIINTHPYNPPMGYVKPTSTMQIKPGRHVDTNGRVYLPYLHEWRHPSSDLLGLIQVIQVVFGEEPPVFARSGTQPAPVNPAVHQTPYPSAGGGASDVTRPPYPTANAGMPMPGYPAYPAQGGANTGGYPPPAGGYTNQQTTPASGYNQGYPYPSQYSGVSAAQTAGAQPPYPTGQSAVSASPAATTPAGSSGGAASSSGVGSGSLTDEQVRLSLLTAVEDKLRRRLRETFAQAQAEMDALQKTQDDLQRGKALLDDMFSRLEHEQNDVESKINMLQQKSAEMSEVLSKLEEREEVDIDEAVIPTAPIYKQILESFAEEQVTEDTIYYLQEGLKRGVIDLDVFLKQVRELSRRQYKMRVLIQKCRQKAGLPDSGIM